jgi:hypothetical protein
LETQKVNLTVILTDWHLEKDSQMRTETLRAIHLEKRTDCQKDLH